MSVDDLRPLLRQVAETCQLYGYVVAMEEGMDAVAFAEAVSLGMAAHAQTAALLTADWYNSLSDTSRYFAVPDDDLPSEKAVNIAEWVFAGPQEPVNRAQMAAHRVVFDAARRTVQLNVLNEGVRMIRSEEPGACKDCVDAAAALSFDFHPSCEGLFVPIRP